MQRNIQARSSGWRPMVWLAALALALALAGCEEPPYPCQAAELSPFQNGCAVSWNCLDGAFRIECTQGDRESALESCTCVASGEPSGTFLVEGLCAETDRAELRDMAADGCGWNVVVDSADAP